MAGFLVAAQLARSGPEDRQKIRCYGLGNGIRLELEGDYRNNRFSQGRDLGFPVAAGGNEVKYA